MALRSLTRTGVAIGGRAVKRSGGVTTTLRQPRLERTASSWTGHVGGSRTPPERLGPSGAGTQLFKLVETDLMSKELSRYESSEAQSLGLYPVADVLSELAAATASLNVSDPPLEALPTEAETDDSQGTPSLQASSTAEASSRQEEFVEEVTSARGGQDERLASEERSQELVGDKVTDVVQIEDVESGPVVTKMAIKRTYQPSTLKRKRMHGFLYRAKTRLGKKILRRRQAKGRWRLGI